MKIFISLLAATVALPLFLGMAASDISEIEGLVSNDDYAFISEFKHYFSSEPAFMLLIGTCLIGIAGMGRAKLSNRDAGNNEKEKPKPNTIPYPDPVPWKKAD